jgi:ABC-type transporter Mla subunit MlaD
MSNKANKLKVGIFVLISIILFTIAMIALGVLNYLKPKYPFMTVVKSTVQGLEKGSKVKFKGVTIGQVTDIQISPEGENILIYMEFNPGSISLKDSKTFKNREDIDDDKEAFKLFVEEKIKEGMRCQLNYSGISGSMYIDIKYYDVKRFPLREFPLPFNHPTYLPSVPNISIGTIFDRIDQSLSKVSKVDFEKIGNQIEQFLASSNKILDDGELNETISEIKALSKNLREVSEGIKKNYNRDKIEKMINQIENVVNNMNSFMNRANAEMQEADLAGTIKTAKNFMTESQKSAHKFNKLQEDFRYSLANLDETLRSAKALIDFIEKNPEAFIRGKSSKEVIESGLKKE